MSMGKLERDTASHKNQQRGKAAAEALALESSLAREQALARDLESNFKRNKNLILIAIATVLIGGGIYATQDTRSALQDGELTDMFRKGTMAASGRVVKEGSAPDSQANEQAGDPLAVPKFESGEERLDAMQIAFSEVISSGPNSGAAHFAALGLAGTALQKGDGEAAAKHVATFLAGETKDSVFRRRALEMAAHALEAQGKAGDGAAQLGALAKGYHEEVKRLAATALAAPSEDLDVRLKIARDHAVDLFIESASMYRRASMAAEAIALLETITTDDQLKLSSERFRADEGLNILGKKGS
jgi:hypothetical protein